jgi:hypothetical protein
MTAVVKAESLTKCFGEVSAVFARAPLVTAETDDCTAGRA